MTSKFRPNEESLNGPIDACPECGSSSIDVTARGSYSSPDDFREDGSRYRCNDCLSHFDDPDKREAQMHSNGGGPGRSKLLKADPEEWP